MIAHRRREFAAGNHRTFSDRIHGSNEVDNRANYDYSGRPHHQKLQGRKSRKPEKEEFRWIVRDGEIPEIPSPKMWGQDGSPTAQSPVHRHQPTSRAQAIAGYRQELMGLVRDLPGPDCELSLLDLVELPKRERISLEEAKEQKKKATVTPERRIPRSASMESGVFLLKMFPFSFGGPRRRRSISRSPSGACSRVSPEKSGLEKSTMSSSSGSSKSGSCGFGKNSSSGRSSKSGSDGLGKNSRSGAKDSNLNRSRKMNGCYAFFFVHGNKARGT